MSRPPAPPTTAAAPKPMVHTEKERPQEEVPNTLEGASKADTNGQMKTVPEEEKQEEARAKEKRNRGQYIAASSGAENFFDEFSGFRLS